MEFLDEQGVQPCGHKAREKGMIIKVLTSCRYNEIPTEYRYSVDGTRNVEGIGVMCCVMSESLLKTQTTDYIDSSHLHCTSQAIYQPCTLPPGLTWRRFKEMKWKPSDAQTSGLISKNTTATMITRKLEEEFQSSEVVSVQIEGNIKDYIKVSHQSCISTFPLALN